MSAPEPSPDVDPTPVPAAQDVDVGARLSRRQQLEHHVRTCPTDLEAYLELARIYRAEDRPLEARRVLGQARQVFPDDERALWDFEEATLARSLQQLRDVSDLAERLRTPEADHELERARSDWARRRIEVCRARLTRDSARVHLRIALGEALIDAGEYDAAIAEVSPLLKLDEYSCQAQLLRARCLLALGNDAAALPALRAAALRRGVVPPPKTRLAALRLLCDAAQRLGLPLTLERYRQQLDQAEQALASPNP